MRIHALAALSLLALLGACADDEPAAAPPGSVTTSASASPSVGACQDVNEPETSLDPGCWAIRATGADDVRFELEVPEGDFTGDHSWVWNNPPREDHWGAITVELAGGVYAHPCRENAEPGDTPRTAADFVSALAAQPVTRTTSPTPVTVDGYDGLYVEATTPSSYDVAACHDEELWLWRIPSGPTTIWAGHVRHLWVLDVDGRLMVLTLATTKDSTPATLATFTSLAESVVITT